MSDEPLRIRPQPGPQSRFVGATEDIVIYGGAAFGGKLLALNTPILTESGWKRNGDLVAGDRVYDERGKPCTVTVAFPVETPKRAYRLTFDDGSQLVAGGEHQWLTYTARELEQAKRRTPEFRQSRQARRKSRATGNRTESFTRAVSERNKRIRPEAKEPPNGSIRTTDEIAETMVGPRGRHNHFIPTAGKIERPFADLPLDPYCLGAWLGDGTRGAGGMTGMDWEILDQFSACGFTVTHSKTVRCAHYVRDLVGKLRRAGVLFQKRIPDAYLRASAEQRLALLQGLMDTDGTVGIDSSPEFTNTNRELAEGALELIRSLGWKANIKEGRATLNGRDCGPVYDIKWTPDAPVFRLKRKLDRQRMPKQRAVKFHTIVACESVEPEPMRCISVDSPSRLYLAGRSLVPTHNSFALLMAPLRWVRNPNFGAVLFRRTYPEIEAEGGLWDESAQLYPLLQGQKRGGMTWQFPSGATVSFSHMADEQDRFRWKSSQIPFIGFDQLETFTEAQFWYLLSRNRSSCGAPLFIRATCNPDPDSFVASLVAWYIDQDTGYAIPERSGVRRYFARDRDTIVWADTPTELLDTLGPECEPKSFTFIRATVEDNPIGVAKNPKYVSNLKALSFVDHAQLRLGNWRVRASAGTMFRREWFEVIDAAPVGTMDEIRYWDLGGSKDGDPSAGVRMGRDRNTGLYYVLDVKLVRDVPHVVAAALKNTASQDGGRVAIGLSCDPGQAGVWQVDHLITALDGHNVITHREHGDKVERAKPFSTQCGHGKVKLVRGEWLDAYLRELENFPSKGWHDDQVDASVNAHKLLLGNAALNAFPEPVETQYHRIMSERMGSQIYA